MPGLRAPRAYSRTEVVNYSRLPCRWGQFRSRRPLPNGPILDAKWTRTPPIGPHRSVKNPTNCRQALCRTRTDDPFLTMEPSGRHERAREGTNGQVPPALDGFRPTRSCPIMVTVAHPELRQGYASPESERACAADCHRESRSHCRAQTGRHRAPMNDAFDAMPPPDRRPAGGETATRNEASRTPHARRRV